LGIALYRNHAIGSPASIGDRKNTVDSDIEIILDLLDAPVFHGHLAQHGRGISGMFVTAPLVAGAILGEQRSNIAWQAQHLPCTMLPALSG